MILHIESQTSNNIFSGIKLLINLMQISLMLHAFSKYKIKRDGNKDQNFNPKLDFEKFWEVLKPL